MCFPPCVCLFACMTLRVSVNMCVHPAYVHSTVLSLGHWSRSSRINVTTDHPIQVLFCDAFLRPEASVRRPACLPAGRPVGLAACLLREKRPSTKEPQQTSPNLLPRFWFSSLWLSCANGANAYCKPLNSRRVLPYRAAPHHVTLRELCRSMA